MKLEFKCICGLVECSDPWHVVALIGIVVFGLSILSFIVALICCLIDWKHSVDCAIERTHENYESLSENRIKLRSLEHSWVGFNARLEYLEEHAVMRRDTK